MLTPTDTREKEGFGFIFCWCCFFFLVFAFEYWRDLVFLLSVILFSFLFFPSIFQRLARIIQLAVTADPNYGVLWCHCKRLPHDTSRDIAMHADALICQELAEYRQL